MYMAISDKVWGEISPSLPVIQLSILENLGLGVSCDYLVT